MNKPITFRLAEGLSRKRFQELVDYLHVLYRVVNVEDNVITLKKPRCEYSRTVLSFILTRYSLESDEP